MESGAARARKWEPKSGEVRVASLVYPWEVESESDLESELEENLGGESGGW